MRKLLLVLCLFVAAAVGPPTAARSEDGGFVLFGVGWFNVGGYRDPIQFDLEWRSTPKVWKLQINAGAMANGDGGVFGFGGVRRDFHFGKTWGTSLGLGVGLWHPGNDGLDLGGAVEFRTSVEFFAEPTARSRLGLNFYHLSNADLYDQNPGSNSIVLVYGRRLK